MEICSHYVIGILPSGMIEVISVLDARVVQRINMKDGKIMSTWENQVIVASSQEVCDIMCSVGYHISHHMSHRMGCDAMGWNEL